MSPRSFTNAFQGLFNPVRVVSFLFGAIFLAMLGNAIYDLCKERFVYFGLGDGPLSLSVIAATSLLALFIAALLFVFFTPRPAPVLPEPGKIAPAPRRGLIYLIGRKEPLLEAIRCHQARLEHVWLVCSKQTSELATELAADPEVNGDGRRLVDVLPVEDVNDPLAFFRVVKAIYENLPRGWRAHEVIADYVGMTAHASVGMAFACYRAEAPLQYTPAEYDANLRPVRPLPPFEVVLRRTKAPPRVVEVA